MLGALARVAIGVVVGLVAAFALTRLMSSLLFGIGPLDAPTYLAALGVLLAAATFASYVPARRAASIDPVETFRRGRTESLAACLARVPARAARLPRKLRIQTTNAIGLDRNRHL